MQRDGNVKYVHQANTLLMILEVVACALNIVLDATRILLLRSWNALSVSLDQALTRTQSVASLHANLISNITSRQRVVELALHTRPIHQGPRSASHVISKTALIASIL